jgi:plasmid stabilization system protein ParE
MTLTLYILPAAEVDLSEIGNYFDGHSESFVESSLSQRFYARFWETAQMLCTSPNLGERCQFRNPLTKGMRMWLVSGFSNYLIFYRQQGNMLQILRVIHGARDYVAIFNNE